MHLFDCAQSSRDGVMQGSFITLSYGCMQRLKETVQHYGKCNLSLTRETTHFCGMLFVLHNWMIFGHKHLPCFLSCHRQVTIKLVKLSLPLYILFSCFPFLTHGAEVLLEFLSSQHIAVSNRDGKSHSRSVYMLPCVVFAVGCQHIVKRFFLKLCQLSKPASNSQSILTQKVTFILLSK